MKSVEFKEHNILIDTGDGEQMPAFLSKDQNLVVTCYRFDDDDLKRINDTKRMFVVTQVDGKGLQPCIMHTDKTKIFNAPVAPKMEIVAVDGIEGHPNENKS